MNHVWLEFISLPLRLLLSLCLFVAWQFQGGFSLQLLDHLERPVLDLTPKVSGVDFVRSDVTAQKYEVRFPNDFTCDNCTLRLLRQADEWSNGYRFWSCADIDIKPKLGFRETCSGKGKFIVGRCKCEKRYYGSRCQYTDECSVDRDCGPQGKCIDIKVQQLWFDFSTELSMQTTILRCIVFNRALRFQDDNVSVTSVGRDETAAKVCSIISKFLFEFVHWILYCLRL